jgi:glycosyltransferase involved in cell wall biosynthesis
MESKTIAFVWDFTVTPVQLHTWKDGLHEALQILTREHGHNVVVIASDDANKIHNDLKELDPDIILCWGSLDRPSFAGIKQLGKPTALCFAGGPTEHPHTDNFDIIFVENQVYLDAFKKQDLNVMIAFGTNERVFRPIKTKKVFDAFYAAAFANWKRHYLFADSVGEKGVVCGKILEHETQNLEVCIEAGCLVLPELPYEALPFLYNQAHSALITAESIGGSQRAVLEAMACNVVPIVMEDNEKCREYIEDSGFGLICKPNVDSIKRAVLNASVYKFKKKGRQYIEAKYSSNKYAKQLQEGLKSIC